MCIISLSCRFEQCRSGCCRLHQSRVDIRVAQLNVLQTGWLDTIPARLQDCKMSREVSAISCRRQQITDRLDCCNSCKTARLQDVQGSLCHILQAATNYRQAGLMQLLQDCKTARCLGESLPYLAGGNRLQVGWPDATPAILQDCKMYREVGHILQAATNYRQAGLMQLLQDCKTAKCLGKCRPYLAGGSRLQVGWPDATPARLQDCKMSRGVSAISCRRQQITGRLA